MVYCYNKTFSSTVSKGEFGKTGECTEVLEPGLKRGYRKKWIAFMKAFV